MAVSKFIHVHSCADQVSAALDATKWAIMGDGSGIRLGREIEVVIVHFYG